MAAIAAAVAAASWAVPAASRSAVWVALAAALAVQWPLGSWLLRAVGSGSERFLLAWASGIAARLLVVAALGLAAPTLGLDVAATLFTLVALLMAFVALEALVARNALAR